MVNIRTASWTLDTCACIIEIEYDDDEPLDTRTFSIIQTLNECAEHNTLPTLEDKWQNIRKENLRKNDSIQTILDSAPTSIYDIVNGIRRFKEGIGVTHSWTGTVPDRILNLTITGITLTNNQKNTIRNVLDNKYGINQVVFN